MSTGSRIVEARNKAGMKQNDLAAAIGASRVTLSRLENNKYQPSPGMLLRIAEATGQDTSFFAETTPAATLPLRANGTVGAVALLRILGHPGVTRPEPDVFADLGFSYDEFVVVAEEQAKLLIREGVDPLEIAVVMFLRGGQGGGTAKQLGLARVA